MLRVWYFPSVMSSSASEWAKFVVSGIFGENAVKFGKRNKQFGNEIYILVLSRDYFPD